MRSDRLAAVCLGAASPGIAPTRFGQIDDLTRSPYLASKEASGDMDGRRKPRRRASQ